MAEQAYAGPPFTPAERGAAWQSLYARFNELPVPQERVWEIEADRLRLIAAAQSWGSSGIKTSASRRTDFVELAVLNESTGQIMRFNFSPPAALRLAERITEAAGVKP